MADSEDELDRPRLTRQRQVILDYLAGSDGFVSSQRVHRALREQGEAIGLTTVYRGLQWLENARILDSIRSEDGEIAYRFCSPTHHHHLICRQCGKATEISTNAIEAWSRAVAAEFNYTDPVHLVEIYGLCPDCTACA